MREFLNKLFQPRPSELSILLEHERWMQERNYALVDKLVGTLDRVVAGKYERAQVAVEDRPLMPQSFTADDLNDVLYTESDEDFLRKVDQITQ